MTTAREMMEFIVDSRAPGLDLSALSDIFDALIWTVNDNGAEILEVRDNWLNSEDPVHVEIALKMREVFPADNRLGLAKILLSIKQKFPHLEQLCDAVLSRWDRQYP